MKSSEVTTLAIVGGAVIAALYFINEADQASSPIGEGAGSGINAAGTGVGVGAAAVGIFGGGALLIWALGNFIFPGA